MTKPGTKPCLQVEVLPAAPEQEPILANLLQLYAYDFSEFLDVEIGTVPAFPVPAFSFSWRALFCRSYDQVDCFPILLTVIIKATALF
jgi:hypothetical protein